MNRKVYLLFFPGQKRYFYALCIKVATDGKVTGKKKGTAKITISMQIKMEQRKQQLRMSL